MTSTAMSASYTTLVLPKTEGNLLISGGDEQKADDTFTHHSQLTANH